MSVVQNSTDLGLTNLTPEFKKAAEPVGISAKASDIAEAEKQQTVITKEQAQGVKNEPLTPEQLEKVAQQLQDFVGEMNHGLEFLVDKDSGRDVIKVIDKSSGDLVKQYPSEEVLTLVAKLSEMVGGFVDAKV